MLGVDQVTRRVSAGPVPQDVTSVFSLSQLHLALLFQSLSPIHLAKEVVLGTITATAILRLPIGWTPQQVSPFQAEL